MSKEAPTRLAKDFAGSVRCALWGVGCACLWPRRLTASSELRRPCSFPLPLLHSWTARSSPQRADTTAAELTGVAAVLLALALPAAAQAAEVNQVRRRGLWPLLVL